MQYEKQKNLTKRSIDQAKLAAGHYTLAISSMKNDIRKMKIGINLNGVSYHDGSSYRKRDYINAIDNLKERVVNPLIEKGHEVSFYVFTYNTIKSKDVERDSSILNFFEKKVSKS